MVSIFRTNENGHGVSNLLAYGEYMVEETYTPSDEIETVAPVTESKVHPANPSEKTQREPATTHEQNSGKGPVVRKLN